jgi:hypothetical protein
MKLWAIARAAVVVLAALPPMASGALAQGVNYNSSKSNTGNITVSPLDPNDPNAVKACTDGGGVVSTSQGKTICTVNKTTSRSNTQHN